MIPHKLTLFLFFLLLGASSIFAQQRKPPAGGRLAVVVEERLAALRATPQLNGKLVRRLGRGRMVAIRSAKNADGVTFFLVNVTSRTHGWIQREAVASPTRAGDDQRLMRLIESSEGFDRLSRARIFLDYFKRSPLRPDVLLLLGDTAEELAKQLSLTRTSVINIEKGRQQVFVHTLTDLARALGVSPSHLLPVEGDLAVLLRDKPEKGREWILNAAGSLADSDKG